MAFIIESPSAFDMRKALYHGASDKGEGSIGRFGTGMKYAIAVLLRFGCPYVKIETGPETWTFKKTEDGRIIGLLANELDPGGKPDVIDTMTHVNYGKRWLPWMAIREFVSNAIDAGGVRVCARAGVMFDTDHLKEEGTEYPITIADTVLDIFKTIETVITIPLPEDDQQTLIEVFENFSKYFLMPEEKERQLICRGDGIRYYINLMDDTRVYMNGVCVFQVNQRSCLKYEFDDIEINEERHVVDPYMMRYRIAYDIINSNSHKLIQYLIDNIKPGDFEESFNFFQGTEISKEWTSRIENLEIRLVSPEEQKFLETMKSIEANKTKVIPENFYALFRGKVPGARAFGSSTSYMDGSIVFEIDDITDCFAWADMMKSMSTAIEIMLNSSVIPRIPNMKEYVMNMLHIGWCYVDKSNSEKDSVVQINKETGKIKILFNASYWDRQDRCNDYEAMFRILMLKGLSNFEAMFLKAYISEEASIKATRRAFRDSEIGTMKPLRITRDKNPVFDDVALSIHDAWSEVGRKIEIV